MVWLEILVSFLEIIFFSLQLLGILIFVGLWILGSWFFFYFLPREYAQGDEDGVYE